MNRSKVSDTPLKEEEVKPVELIVESFYEPQLDTSPVRRSEFSPYDIPEEEGSSL